MKKKLIFVLAAYFSIGLLISFTVMYLFVWLGTGKQPSVAKSLFLCLPLPTIGVSLLMCMLIFFRKR